MWENLNQWHQWKGQDECGVPETASRKEEGDWFHTVQVPNINF